MLRKFVKKLASLKLAVAIVLALAALAAWGTFVEARYNDAAAAQRIVYHSVWMLSVMALLALSLIAVMVDRWPWQKRHLGFVLAHIGILILIAGAILTQKMGLDGSMAFGIGESSRQVAVSQVDLGVYSSLNGDSYAKIFDQEVDFFQRPPRERPLEISVPDGEIAVVDFIPYALRDEKVVAAGLDDSSELADDDAEPPAEKGSAKGGQGGQNAQRARESGAAVRFQLQNDRVNMTDWVQQTTATRDAVRDLGPARVVLARQEPLPATEGNAIVLRLTGNGDEIAYEVRTARTPKSVKRGLARAGDAIETGWMGLVFRVLKVLPRAKTEVTFVPVETASPLTSAALKVRFRGQERWLGLNSTLKFFSNNAVYVVTYGNRRVDLGFSMKLDKFSVGRYQGTMRAASYESVVSAPEIGSVVVSMNEPLKYKGFTFYQASFSEDERGRPIASILSVNRDPGRPAKYLGSLLIVLGAIHMFYFKRAMRKKAVAAAEPTAAPANARGARGRQAKGGRA